MRLTLLSLVLLTSLSTFAASKTYQVTGEVTDVSDTKVTITKAGEKFEIDRGPSTKVTGDLKKGGKATVWYSMSAQEVEVKGDKAAEGKAADKAAPKKK